MLGFSCHRDVKLRIKVNTVSVKGRSDDETNGRANPVPFHLERELRRRKLSGTRKKKMMTTVIGCEQSVSERRTCTEVQEAMTLKKLFRTYVFL